MNMRRSHWRTVSTATDASCCAALRKFHAALSERHQQCLLEDTTSSDGALGDAAAGSSMAITRTTVQHRVLRHHAVLCRQSSFNGFQPVTSSSTRRRRTARPRQPPRTITMEVISASRASKHHPGHFGSRPRAARMRRKPVSFQAKQFRLTTKPVAARSCAVGAAS